MNVVLRIIRESILQAVQQLRGNKLRSFLSLLGVSIGIFCIIGVLSAVDSLEDNVRGSLEKLGNDIVYVKKWPWADVGNDWWKYFKRPNPSHEDYEAVRERSQLSEMVSFHVVVGFKTLKFGSSSIDGALLIACSMEFTEMFKLEYDKGRYFSSSEYNYGSNRVVLGYKVYEELFGENIDPIGRQVKLQGKDYEVIGVIEKAGNDLLNPLDFDQCILVTYPNGRSLANLRASQIFDATVTVKAAENVGLAEMKDEVRGILRAKHRIKPRESEDFSLNELSMISKIFDSFFAVLNILGIIIGLFAMLVGIVSVANIMFVSVKERTSIIGIKKALGAKQYVILLEFLIEAIILCILGGLIGLLLIFLTTKILTAATGFDFYIDLGNTILGMGVSVAVGVISGIIPALRAARMDPVEAMRK